ncbi:hypothetical protein DL89DRAFT_80939 [Linderina pennispora]|uniref:Uncharacterized protein n=1 Tax=Linderina pennispora TaxID=61395 RepID=A0A1Y1WGJ4_9FUNG|nr:uncharacterized protein DL89DRAFT_80939 [Linderina pennispora]ORX72671.1 hypothetical protein DL89DRAFT_80939 [Linderina pennispora]
MDGPRSPIPDMLFSALPSTEPSFKDPPRYIPVTWPGFFSMHPHASRPRKRQDSAGLQPVCKA